MGSELQVENYSGWLQMENSAGLSQRTTVGSFIWRTTAMSSRPRSAVVGFIWSTLYWWWASLGKRKWRASDGEIQQWTIHGVQQWWASIKER